MGLRVQAAGGAQQVGLKGLDAGVGFLQQVLEAVDVGQLFVSSNLRRDAVLLLPNLLLPLRQLRYLLRA